MQYAKNYWQNSECFEENRIPAHTHHTSSADFVKKGVDFMSLNGDWQFQWQATPMETPAGFELPTYDASQWEAIPVPSNWEMEGYSIPQYVNIGPMEGLQKQAIPTIDAAFNDVGCYRKIFEVNANWLEKKVWVHFGGVASAFLLWCNGEYVGYSQDSMLPAEFDLAPHLKEGENLLAVQVYSLSDGSYLEDQDKWRLSGIFRDVFLIAYPETFWFDYQLTPTFEDDFSVATLEVRHVIQHDGEARQDCVLAIQVKTPDGKAVEVEETISLVPNALTQTTMTLKIERPLLWSAEIPTLYSLQMRLLDRAGQVLEEIEQEYGLRESKIVGNEFHLNGKAILLLGVNRHELHPERGHALTREDIEKDLRLLKRHHFNAVRTSHYPNQPYFYTLCDQLGLYVMDEANLESHGWREKVPASRPEWRAATVARVTRMVERDKNHASIVIWSLGNEAGVGENFVLAKEAAVALDASRPYHYEPDRVLAATDFNSMMYPGLVKFQSVVERRTIKVMETDSVGKIVFPPFYSPEVLAQAPFLLCEFVHAMGNAVADLPVYQYYFEEYPQYAGGFIWDFADQALRIKKEDGGQAWAYGGDFGERIHDGNFCNNGLLNPNREPHPTFWEAVKVFQPYSLTLTDSAKMNIAVKNHQFFRSVEQMQLHWRLFTSQKTFAEGKDVVGAIAPRETKMVLLEEARLDLSLIDQPVYLLMELVATEAMPFVEQGEVIAWDQAVIGSTDALPKKPLVNLATATIEQQENDDRLDYQVGQVSYQFDKKAGFLTQICYGEKEFLTSPIKPNLFRVYSGNDVFRPEMMAQIPAIGRPFIREKDWQAVMEKRKLGRFVPQTSDDGAAIVRTAFRLPLRKSMLAMDYLIDLDGSLILAYQARFKQSPPRVGWCTILPVDLQYVTWFGRGPMETMRNRKAAGRFDCFEAKIGELSSNYILPQENGNRTDTSWLEIKNETGQGLRLEAMPVDGPTSFNFTLWDYTRDDVLAHRHFDEMPRGKQIMLQVDIDQRGTNELGELMDSPTDYMLPRKSRYVMKLKVTPLG